MRLGCDVVCWDGGLELSNLEGDLSLGVFPFLFAKPR